MKGKDQARMMPDLVLTITMVGGRRNCEHRPKSSSRCLFYIQVGCWYTQKNTDRVQNQGLKFGTYESCHTHRHLDALATALVNDITLIKKKDRAQKRS